jgi:hypothetical protein
MDDQKNPRVTDDFSDERPEESRTEERAAVFAARLLANPRRVRL